MNAAAHAAPAVESDNSSPFVSAIHINAMCTPLTQPAAQIKFLKSLGLTVGTMRNGRPLLMKSELERVLGAGQVDAQPQASANTTAPNVTALDDYFNRRKVHGSSSQGR